MTSTLLRALRGAHIDDIVLDEQVAAFDEFDAELVGQEGMFVIGRVELAGRQQRDRRFACGRLRRDRPQSGEQGIWIIFDRGDAMLGEKIGHEAHHNLAILQHVGDPGRSADIVFEHVEVVFARADDINAGDMDVNIVRHRTARPFPAGIRHCARQDRPGCCPP